MRCLGGDINIKAREKDINITGSNIDGENINHSFDNGKQAGDAVDARTFDDEVKKNDKGLTPNMAGSSGSADSTTKAAIDPGTIDIKSDAGKDDKSKTDTNSLSRDTASANNPLNPIFDKDKILEKQEAAAVFGEVGFGIVGKIIYNNKWANDDPRAIALHALVGGIMAEINGGKFGEGLSTAAINKLLIAELAKIYKKDKDGKTLLDENGKPIRELSGAQLRWISAALGVALDGNQGAGIADSATRNNALSQEDKNEFDKRLANGEDKNELIKEFIKRSSENDDTGTLIVGDKVYSIDQDGNFTEGKITELTVESAKDMVITTTSALVVVGVVTGVSTYVVFEVGSITYRASAATLAANPALAQKVYDKIPISFAREVAAKLNWQWPNGATIYPPNGGAIPGTVIQTTLQVGQVLGRYGEVGINSRFITQAGASASALALPPGTNQAIYAE